MSQQDQSESTRDGSAATRKDDASGFWTLTDAAFRFFSGVLEALHGHPALAVIWGIAVLSLVLVVAVLELSKLDGGQQLAFVIATLVGTLVLAYLVTQSLARGAAPLGQINDGQRQHTQKVGRSYGAVALLLTALVIGALLVFPPGRLSSQMAGGAGFSGAPGVANGPLGLFPFVRLAGPDVEQLVKEYSARVDADGQVGTGIILSNQRVLTAYHLVANKQKITLRYMGSLTRYPASVGAVDVRRDLAILMPGNSPAERPGATFTSLDRPAFVWVAASLGTPLKAQVTSVCSDQGCHIRANGSLEPESSGAALADENGRFVGVITDAGSNPDSFDALDGRQVNAFIEDATNQRTKSPCEQADLKLNRVWISREDVIAGAHPLFGYQLANGSDVDIPVALRAEVKGPGDRDWPDSPRATQVVKAHSEGVYAVQRNDIAWDPGTYDVRWRLDCGTATRASGPQRLRVQPLSATGVDKNLIDWTLQQWASQLNANGIETAWTHLGTDVPNITNASWKAFFKKQRFVSIESIRRNPNRDTNGCASVEVEGTWYPGDDDETPRLWRAGIRLMLCDERTDQAQAARWGIQGFEGLNPTASPRSWSP